MAPGKPAEEQSLLRNMDGADEGDIDHVVAVTNDATPLLPTDLPPDIVPDKRFRRMVMIMGGVVLVVITISQIIVLPAQQEIMEDVICRQIHPDHKLGLFKVVDDRCKDNDVQKTLAMVRSWSTTCELLVPLLVQIPYGILGDKYGRQPVLFTALFGVTLVQTWSIIVLLYPDTFNIWAILYGNFGFLIGGGGQTAIAMIYTVITDTTPAAQRSGAFYVIAAALKLIVVGATPFAAFLLSIDPWITLWLGFGAFLLGNVTALLIPETLHLRRKADAQERADHGSPDPAPLAPIVSRKAFLSQAWLSARNDALHIWKFLLGSRSIMLLLLACAASFPMNISLGSDLLQYMTKRFHWSWSTATYVTTIQNLAGAGALLSVVPLLAAYLTRIGFSPLHRDLFTARASAIAALAGCIIIAFAPTPWLSITALVIHSIGSGFSALIRAILCSIVEPHTVGTVNTLVGVAESTVAIVSAPFLGWLLSRGMELGGVWQGLPFMVLCVFGLLSAVLTLIFRIPAGVAHR